MQSDPNIDETPVSQRPTIPEPAPERVEVPKLPKSKAVLETAWFMVEKLFGKEPVQS